jgi:hypothetical protein
MKRLAVLVIILSCLPVAPAVAHDDDPRCERAKEQTAGAIQNLAAAQKKYNRAKNRLQNAHGKKAKKKASNAKRRAKGALDTAKGAVRRGEQREQQYCKDSH